MQKYSITINEFYLVHDTELKIDTLLETHCVRYHTTIQTKQLPSYQLKMAFLLQNHADLWF